MRRVRNEDAIARGLAAVVVIGAHHQEPSELAVRAGGRLQRHRGKAADFGEPALQRKDHGEVALHRFRVLERMSVGEAREAGDRLVLLGIVFHGAGAERIEAAVDAEIALRQREVMAHHLELGELRQSAVGARILRQRRRRHIERRQIDAAAPRHARFIDGRNGAGFHGGLPIDLTPPPCAARRPGGRSRRGC